MQFLKNTVNKVTGRGGNQAPQLINTGQAAQESYEEYSGDEQDHQRRAPPAQQRQQRRELTKEEESVVKKLIKPMKKLKAEDDWNQKYQEGYDQLVASHDYIVVEEFNKQVQLTKESMKFKKTAPTDDQAEDEESLQEQAFREWFAQCVYEDVETCKPFIEGLEQRKQAIQALPDEERKAIEDRFLEVSQYSGTHDEKGFSLTRDELTNQYNRQQSQAVNRQQSTRMDQPYWKDSESGDSYDEKIRAHVYMMLKYAGNMQHMIRSDYHTDDSVQEEFWYRASEKVPFYYLIKVSPKSVQNLMLDKYLENPINPLMFVEYNQTTAELERTINCNLAYHKLRDDYFQTGSTARGNLLCVGNSNIGKSTLLNQMFNLQFEINTPRQKGLFHQSVDVIFATGDTQPLDVNVFDFQGERANEDFVLICDLLEKMPCAYLMIQLCDVYYLRRLKKEMDKRGLIDKFAKRFIAISRNEQQWDNIKDEVLNTFDTDEEKRIFKISDITIEDGEEESKLYDPQSESKLYFPGRSEIRYDPAVKNYTENQCSKIFHYLREQINQLRSSFEREVHRPNDQRRQDDGKVLEYKSLFGFYWCFEDRLFELDKKQGYQVIPKPSQFRLDHMRVKRMLDKMISSKKILQREELFPLYTIRRKQQDKIKQLRKLTKSKEEVEEIHAEIDNLQKEQGEKEHKDIYNEVFKFFLEGQIDQFYDSLSQMQHVYKTDVKDDRKKLERKSLDYETQNRKAERITDKDEREGLQKIVEDLKDELDQLRDKIDSRVLDAEIFFRNAKLHVKLTDNAQNTNRFHKQIGYAFTQGRPIEVIDGDIDMIDDISLRKVMDWVFERRQCNNELFVVSIMGAQSTGKSTLLNYLLGSNFRVSAGRCTKGLNATLFVTDVVGAKEMLLLDSEGLFSTERTDPKFDRRLATFCVAVSNFLMINIKGELSTDVQDVLETVVYTIGRNPALFSLVKKPRIHFVLRDQTDALPTQMKDSYTKVSNSLRQAAGAAGTELENIIELPEMEKFEQAFDIFSCAISPKLIGGNSSYKPIELSLRFREGCCKLRKRILDFATQLKPERRCINLRKWAQEAEIVWAAVKESDDFASLTNLKHIREHRKLVATLKKVYEIHSNEEFKGKPDDEKVSNPLLYGVGEISSDLLGKKDLLITQTVTSHLEAVYKQKMEMKPHAGMQLKEIRKAKDLEPLQNIFEFEQITKQAIEVRENEMWIELQGQATEFTKSMSTGLQEQARLAVLGMIKKLSVQQCEKLFKEIAIDKHFSFLCDCMRELPNIQQQSIEQKVDCMVNKGNQAKSENTRSIETSEDQVRQQAIQIFQEIVEPARAASQEMEESKVEENKEQANVENFAQYTILRSDALCLRKTSVDDLEVLLSSPNQLTQKQIDRFTKVDDNILEAALNAKQSEYSEEQCRNIINEKINQQIFHIRNAIQKVVEKERKVHLNANDNPTQIKEAFYKSLLEIYQWEMHRQKVQLDSKNVMYEEIRNGPHQVGDEFIESCVQHNQLEYVNAFEEVVYEIVYRRQRHNNSCAIRMAEKKFDLVINNFKENPQKLTQK